MSTGRTICPVASNTFAFTSSGGSEIRWTYLWNVARHVTPQRRPSLAAGIPVWFRYSLNVTVDDSNPFLTPRQHISYRLVNESTDRPEGGSMVEPPLQGDDEAPERMANRIRELRESRGLTLEALGALCRTTKQQMYKLERGDVQLTQKWMERIANALNVAPADILPQRTPAPKVSPAAPTLTKDYPLGPITQSATVLPPLVADLPILGSAQGGFRGVLMIPTESEAVGYTFRPPQLQGVPGAFALYVVDDSMVPRYEHGMLVWVHPHITPRPGNYCVVIKHSDEVLIKQLVRRTERTVTLRQLNPVEEIDLPAVEVRHIYFVFGSLDIR
jgi:phage repressor protein C with HTH and peptisase S24 domain